MQNPWKPSTAHRRVWPLNWLLAGRQFARQPGLNSYKRVTPIGQGDVDFDYADPQTPTEILGPELHHKYSSDLVVSSVDPEHKAHQITLDIDLPALMIESQSGKGHYHLYINTPEPIPAKKYFKLLKMLADLGVIEKNYYKHSKRRGFSALRTPPDVEEPMVIDRAAPLW